MSHDSDAPRSITVTAGMLRVLATLGALIVLAGLLGLGIVVVGVTTRWAAGGGATGSPQVAELRAQVGALRGALDSIQQQEVVLREAAGEPRADSSALLRRFFPRMPRILAGSRRSSNLATASLPPIGADSAAVQGAAATAGASADSLTAHATTVLDRMRRLAANSRQRDSLFETWVLRPENLREVASAGSRTSDGSAVELRARRPTAVVLGVAAVITRVAPDTDGRWTVEWRGPARETGRLTAPARPLVRERERVTDDQLIFVLDPPALHALPLRVELLRAGVPLDPTTGRPTQVR